MNAHSAREAFIQNLLSRMTLEEKIGQLTQIAADPTLSGAAGAKRDDLAEIRGGRVGSVLNATSPELIRKLQETAKESRLKIPLLFGLDVIHGYRTAFPIPLGEAASWDLELMKKTARAAAQEAAQEGLHWTFAPMVDIARDPRWGRVMEGAGEDPWLASRIAEARVQGFQGATLNDPTSLIACVKHFAAYGAPVGGRDYNTVDMSRRELLSTYLPPYRAAVKAGAATLMTAFNDLEGIPSTAHTGLLKDVLRESWGFKGFVVSDWHSIKEMVAHGTAADDREAVLQAFKAGVDMEMDSDLYKRHLPGLLKDGKVRLESLNEAVRRILRVKYDKGLFAPPLRQLASVDPALSASNVTLSASDLRALAREAARRSMVLLQNKHDVLPLSRTARIALVGPLADDKRHMNGNWAALADWRHSVTLREGLAQAHSDRSKIRYAKGSNLLDPGPLLDYLNKHSSGISIDPKPAEQLLQDAVEIARTAEVVVVALGEAWNMYGEAASRSQIRIPEAQLRLLRALKGAGKKIVLVVFNGRPLVLSEEAELADAILIAWAPGVEAGNAVADVLYGAWNPSGKLPMTFPRNEGQIPIYYGQKSTGRPFDGKSWFTSKYLDVSNDPLFSFGHGLSYTTFAYGTPTVTPGRMAAKGKVKVSVSVENTGARAGEETVQLYIRDVVASATRPTLELRGMSKVTLAPKEKRLVEFELTAEDLKFWSADLRWSLEPGEFKVFVGGSSRDLREATFTVSP